MDASEIDKVFLKMRKAGHGSLIKFDASGTGQLAEGIIFEPVPRRPPGFEAGVFVTVPSDKNAIYYFDPEASKKQGRIIAQKLDAKQEKEQETPPDNALKEFDHIRNAPGVKIGGGAVGESHSKYTGILNLKK